MSTIIKKPLVLAMAMALVVAISACSKEESNLPSPSMVEPPQASYDSQTGKYQPVVPNISKEFTDAHKKNSDVIAWLQLPNTNINEAVVQTTNNEFYLRRDVNKKYSYEGCYYMDYESVIFDEGADLARNTLIYGHNLGNPMGKKDDPNGVKFAQLLKMKDVELAKRTPYIFLTTESGNQIFAIFAVFYCEAVTDPVPYHYADYSDDKYLTLLDDVKKRSLYTYDVPVGAEDKIITLSTCSYEFGTYSQNPDQRFVVMGKLMKEGEEFTETAQLTVNPSPKMPKYS